MLQNTILDFSGCVKLINSGTGSFINYLFMQTVIDSDRDLNLLLYARPSYTDSWAVCLEAETTRWVVGQYKTDTAQALQVSTHNEAEPFYPVPVKASKFRLARNLKIQIFAFPSVLNFVT